MSRRRILADHCTVAALEARYRHARDPVARSQWQIIWLLAREEPSAVVVAATGYSPGWIATVVGRYNRDGVAGIGDRRHRNAGARPLLALDQQAALRAALAQPAPDGGLWTGPKVAAWIAERLGRPVHAQRGWEYLRRLGYTPQVPRPAHTEADPAAQAAFKQTSPRR
jgi:transposase